MVITANSREQLFQKVAITIVWRIDIKQNDKPGEQLIRNNDKSPICISNHFLSLKRDVLVYKDCCSSGLELNP